MKPNDNPAADTLAPLLERAAEAIAASRHLTAFTGAGISVESGIPPFRGPGGVWETYDPEVLDIEFFLAHPDESWKAIRALFTSFLGTGGRPPVRPNPAHEILAKWEARGLLHCTVTQNIDGLHAAAGSRELVEYHGHCRTMTCLACGNRVPLNAETVAPKVPLCRCGGLFKPDFIFFGEGIPPEASSRAAKEAMLTDCMVLVGTSGAVYPAAGVPVDAKRRGAFIIEVNPVPTPFTDRITDVFLPMKAAAAFLALDALLAGTGPKA